MELLLLAGAVGTLAVVLNQAQARLGLVEVTLTEGLPPGHETTTIGGVDVGSEDPIDGLGFGIHVFVSRNCHACQRLVEELVQDDPATPLTLHHVGRASAALRQLGSQPPNTLVESTPERTQRLGADPLPYTIAVGPHRLVSRGVTPTPQSIDEIARSAGMGAR